MLRIITAAAFTAIVLGVTADHASAATISATPDPDHANETLGHYVAAPGEVNDLTVTSLSYYAVRVHDPGAVITAGQDCVSIDAHTAECTSPVEPGAGQRFMDFVAVDAGDMDDRVSAVGEGLAADGGPGDDELWGDDRGDRLDGGGGHDELHGGDNADQLVDGDASGAGDADVLDGGDDLDTVSYAGRTAPVTVDLAGGIAGEPGEGDALVDVEGATGGAGDDRLEGGNGRNDLEGGPGDDRVDGGDGDDILTGGAGRDLVVGGRGDDQLDGGDGDDRLSGGSGADRLDLPGAGADRADCDGGRDTAIDPRRDDLLRPGCETVVFGYGDAHEDWLSAGAYPFRRTRSAVSFAVGCPRPEVLDGLSEPIRGTLRVHEASGRRRSLASGTIGRAGARCGGDPPASGVNVRLAITSLGRRLAGRDGGVRSTVSLRGTNLPSRAWTIVLKVPARG